MPTPSYDAANTGFGSGSNRTKFDTKGQRLATGEAVGYEDLATTLQGKKLSLTNGTVQWDYDRHAAEFDPSGSITTNNDKVGGEHQYPHSAQVDGIMHYHMHWVQTDTFANLAAEFTFRYRLSSNGGEETTAWTTVVVEPSDDNSVFEYDGETGLIQITNLAEVDMTGASISALVEWEFTRTDSTAGSLFVKYIDPHYIQDTDGSNVEFVKDEGA